MTSPIEYSAIKSGIISITKYLAKYYSKKNFKINCISPGGIKDNFPKKFIKNYKKQCNSKGLLDPKDVTNAIDFLLSKKSNFISGQNIVIDDGYTL
jgi:NAD(P)-dependent dehydrogenase (short-subunit alcohol dehydrogenase family)